MHDEFVEPSKSVANEIVNIDNFDEKVEKVVEFVSKVVK